MYLLDTNVLSELRKHLSGRIDPGVAAWANTVAQDRMYLSVITLTEVEFGIARLEPNDPPQANLLRTWLYDRVLPTFTGRILPVDQPISLRAGGLHMPKPKDAHDALIAATALIHGFIVVTRNVSDFTGNGVSILDPWTSGKVVTSP